ncbi:MAG: hypothetical protein QW343_03550 [Candidatus Norongarragalinales archaeon]
MFVKHFNSAVKRLVVLIHQSQQRSCLAVRQCENRFAAVGGWYAGLN